MNLRIFSSEQLDQADKFILDSDSLHIWFLSRRDVDHPSLSARLLSADERLRAEQFAHALDRDCYVVAHTALRMLLSIYLDCPPGKLRFSIGGHGKPELLPLSPNSCPVYFNLSHSGNQVALAFSARSAVGIDVQKVDTTADTEKLRSRFFHPAEAPFFSKLKVSERGTLFYRFWTVREAFLKALGTGLSLPPDSFCVEPLKKDISEEMSLSQSQYYKVSAESADYSAWTIQSVPAPDGYLCSVAYNSILISR